jgi:hypothetical protein
MAKYKAQWVKGQQCRVSRGKVVAEAAADSLPEFAKQLCNVYGNGLGDGFSFCKFDSEKEIEDCYGEDLPEWHKQTTDYPVFVFSSNFGAEILCKPTATAIINQICGESYGDYDLEVKGV